MSGILIISLVVVFGPMLCLLWLAMGSATLAEDRRVTRPDPSADDWRMPRTIVAPPRPVDAGPTRTGPDADRHQRALVDFRTGPT